jgi:peptide/nickel transport system permease protein
VKTLGVRGVTAAAVVLLLALLAVAAPLIARHDPNAGGLLRRLQPPAFTGGSWTHPLGTDPLGRDVFARTLHGARVSLSIAAIATLVSAAVGTTLGSFAGWGRSGWFDQGVSYLIDVQLSLPFILLAIATTLVLGTSPTVLVALAALAGWPAYARVTRGVALTLREREFVLAARALGASDARIVLRHLLPNLAAPLIVLATLGIGSIVLFESALSFLGIGIRPPQASWGVMIAEGREYLVRAPWLTLVPSAFLVAFTLSVGVLGDVLRDRLDVRTAP